MLVSLGPVLVPHSLAVQFICTFSSMDWWWVLNMGSVVPEVWCCVTEYSGTSFKDHAFWNLFLSHFYVNDFQTKDHSTFGTHSCSFHKLYGGHWQSETYRSNFGRQRHGTCDSRIWREDAEKWGLDTECGFLTQIILVVFTLVDPFWGHSNTPPFKTIQAVPGQWVALFEGHTSIEYFDLKIVLTKCLFSSLRKYTCYFCLQCAREII